LELEESRAELESARTNFEAELNAAYEAQKSAESNVEEMNEQIKSYEAELLAIGSLELQLDEAQAKLTAYELSSGELRKELDSAQLELENAGSNVAAAEAKVRASELELSDLRLKVEEKESQISGRNSTVQNLEQRLFEMEELSEKSKADLENARSAFEAELSAAHEEQRVAETNVEAANEKVKATESELMDLRARIENFEAQSQEKENLLQEEARVLRVKIEEFENAERGLERQVSEARENLRDAETREKSSEVQLANLQNEVDALKDTVASSTNILRQKEMESEAQMVVLQNEKLRAEIQMATMATEQQRIQLEDTSMQLPFSVDAKFVVKFDLPPHQFLALTGSWCDWKVNASEEMTCANKMTWTKEVPLGLDVTHEYKYVICERDSNGQPKQVEWQNGDNSMFGASSGALQNMRGDVEIHDTWIPNATKNLVFLFSKSGGKFETDRNRMLQDCLDAQTYGVSQNYTSHIVDDMYSALGGDSTYEPTKNSNTQSGGGESKHALGGGEDFFNVVDDGFGESIRKSYEYVDSDDDDTDEDFIVIDI
jgi:chromosome segregation ATPase